MLFDRLHVPVLLVASMLSAAAGAGVVAGVERLKAERESHAIRLERIEAELRTMSERTAKSLERIENKLEAR
jgi:hypothetical protein